MITRIVKMDFNLEDVPVFLSMIETAYPSISNFNGCLSLEVVQDTEQPNLFFTYSTWVSEDSLNDYRKSELFQTIWPKTKALFAAKPETWTLTKLNLKQ